MSKKYQNQSTNTIIRGFTLIELLAVIVILAIIALIATPLVLKYIEYSKEKSAKLSANTYAEAVEKEYVSKLTSNEKMPNKEYTIKELDELGVKVKGDRPEGENDSVTLENGNVIGYTLTINGYIVKYEDGKVTVDSNVVRDNASCIESVDHTVKFMADGKLYETISVKDGNPINAPLGIPTSENGKFGKWSLNGSDVIFPYTPTEDVEITAVFAIVSQELYERFGVDRNVYPYIVIPEISWTISKRQFSLYFFKEIIYNETDNRLEGVKDYKIVTSQYMDGTDRLTIGEILNYFIDHPEIELGSNVYDNHAFLSSSFYYTNNEFFLETYPNTEYFE